MTAVAGSCVAVLALVAVLAGVSGLLGDRDVVWTFAAAAVWVAVFAGGCWVADKVIGSSPDAG